MRPSVLVDAVDVEVGVGVVGGVGVEVDVVDVVVGVGVGGVVVVARMVVVGSVE